jgi:hypothetical protein
MLIKYTTYPTNKKPHESTTGGQDVGLDVVERVNLF